MKTLIEYSRKRENFLSKNGWSELTTFPRQMKPNCSIWSSLLLDEQNPFCISKTLRMKDNEETHLIYLKKEWQNSQQNVYLQWWLTLPEGEACSLGRIGMMDSEPGPIDYRPGHIVEEPKIEVSTNNYSLAAKGINPIHHLKQLQPWIIWNPMTRVALDGWCSEISEQSSLMKSYKMCSEENEEDSRRTLGFFGFNEVDGPEVRTRTIALISTLTRDT